MEQGSEHGEQRFAVLTGTVLAEEERRTARDTPVAEPVAAFAQEQMSLRDGLMRGGARLFVVLALINSLDELETAALSVLAPDIADTFGISDGAIVFLTAAAGAFIVLGAVPMGWLADRFRRGPIVGISSIVFSAMMVVSAVAPNIFVFFWGRFGGGIAKSNSGPVQQSMLADAYPIGIRGRLQATLGVTQRVAGVLSPLLVGAIAAIAGGTEGWRWAFALLGLPVLAVAGFAFFVPEPVRGRWEKQDTTGEVLIDERPPPISIEAAFARLKAVRTIRTALLALSALGFGIVTLPVLANLYVEDRFGTDALGRGMMSVVPAIVALVTLPFLGRYYDHLFRTDPPRVLVLLGWVLLPSTALVPLQLFAPNVVLFTLLSIPQGVLFFSALPMLFALLQAVVPYRIRGLGSSLGSVFIFFFGATGGALASLPLTNAYGPRTTILVTLIPASVVAGIILIRGARDVPHDLALVAAELQEEHDEDLRRLADPDDVPVVQVRDIEFAYGDVPVLFGVSLEVRPGEVLALLGTNGAGKSTVLRAISGLITPSRGVVRFHGRTITFTAPEQRARMGIVSLTGGDGVFGDLTVRANLEMAAFVYRGEPDGGAARIERALALFPVLAGRDGQRAGSLSGGQQQQLALAMALVHDPELLLIDELSLGLSPAVVAELLEVIERLRANGLPMIIVEQSLNVAAAISDRAIFLEKGQVRFEGTAAELMARGDLARAVFLGGDGG